MYPIHARSRRLFCSIRMNIFFFHSSLFLGSVSLIIVFTIHVGKIQVVIVYIYTYISYNIYIYCHIGAQKVYYIHYTHINLSCVIPVKQASSAIGEDLAAKQYILLVYIPSCLSYIAYYTISTSPYTSMCV